MKLQVLPEQQIVGLLVERHIGVVVGMHEKVRGRFVVPPAAADEIEMLVRAVFELAAVAGQRRIAAAFAATGRSISGFCSASSSISS